MRRHVVYCMCFLACSAKVAKKAIYFTVRNFFLFLSSFLMISRRQIISRSAGPIFAIFTSNASFLAVDDRSGPPFRYLKGHCHGNRFCAKMRQNCLPTALIALAFRNGMGYRYVNGRVNSWNDACILCENFVKFGPVTPELTGLIWERLVWHGQKWTYLV